MAVKNRFDELTKQYNKIPDGAFVKTDQGYYVKPEQNLRVLEECLIKLGTGEVIHFSFMEKLEEVSHNEIMW